MATLVNTNHKNAEDMNTPMFVLNMNHMASIFNGKLMMVPITVSLIASRQAARFLNILYCSYRSGGWPRSFVRVIGW